MELQPASGNNIEIPDLAVQDVFGANTANVQPSLQNQMCPEGAKNDISSADQTPEQELQSDATAPDCKVLAEQTTVDLKHESLNTSIKNPNHSLSYHTRKFTPPHKRQCLCRKLGKLDTNAKKSSKLLETNHGKCC